MSWQKYFVATLFAFTVIALSGCTADTKKYQDTSALEKPPEIGVSAQEASEGNSDSGGQQTNKGLGDVVKRVDDSHLELLLSFGEAWKQVGKAITLSGMEISDKNIQKGQYYVEFDTSSAANKGEENLFTSLFSKIKQNKARYLLTLSEVSQGIAVKTEFLEYTESHDFSQDGYAEPVPTDNGLPKFTQTLYTTLHDELPLTP